MTEQDNHTAVVDAWLDAHNEHDVDAMLALVSDDVSIGSASDPHARLVGQSAAAEFWTAMFTTFPDHRLERLAITSEDDRVVVEATETGTMRGPLGPNQPTGRSFEVQAAFRFGVSGSGRIDAITSYFDMGAVGRQLELAG